MRITDHIKCGHFPCDDVKHECYTIPDIDVNASDISIILISEAPPADPSDYYYASGDPLFQQTTVQAFKDAGEDVSS